MRRILVTVLTILIALSLSGISVSAQETNKLPHEAVEEFSAKANVLISQSDFEKTAKSGMIKYINVFDGMSYAPYSVAETDNMVFEKAVKLECVTPPSSWINAAVKVDFDTSSSAFKSMKKGDTLLLRYTVKGLEGECQLSVRLWNTQSQDYNLINQGSRVSLDSGWSAYYYPMTISEDTHIPNQLIFKTNNAKQTILIGDFELINYGTDVTKEQLSAALADAGAYRVNDGICPYYTCEPEYRTNDEENDDETERTEEIMISNEYFMNRATVIGTNGTVTKTAISADDAEKFGLGFTDTITASCTSASGISSFGFTCNVANDAVKTVSGDTVRLTFYARAKSVNTKVSAAIVSKNGAVLGNPKGANNDRTEYTYFIPTQWTKIVVPVSVSGEVGGIKLTMGSLVSEVEFGGVLLEKLPEDADHFFLPAGYFLCEPYTRLVVDYNEGNYLDRNKVSKCNDIEIHGKYLYAIGGGNLYIISTETNTVTGMVSGMGETRQIAINEDATTAVVTSRVDGAFVIALDDKTNPQIVGRCDTIEYATGVAMANNRCYITNRMFGTEIIDLTDRTLPKNIALVRTGEAQSCEIVGTTLYAGCWGERRVEVWDVSQPSEPVLLNKSIPANGKGDGLCVMGNYLYISTGHMDTYQSTKGTHNIGYGHGNGMDIYDISDIKNPVFLSTVRIDDHFYTNGQDFWTVKVAKNGDKVYAYMVNTFNGVYIFDVTDPKAPIRLAAIELTVTKRSNLTVFESLERAFGHNGESRKSYFPYDAYERQNSPIGGIAVADGKLYIGAVSFGVAQIDTDDVGNILFAENKEAGAKIPDADKGTFYDVDLGALKEAGFTDICYNLPGGQVYSVDEKDGLIYASCGNQGIKILDSSLEVIKEFPARSDAIVSEAVVRGNRLYTAEGLAGVAIYEISKDGMELREISRYISAYSPGSSSIYSVKFLRLSPDGNFVLCDSGSANCEIVDFTDLSNPVRWNGEGSTSSNGRFHGSGLMYYRHLCTALVGNRYLCGYGYGRNTYWFDFGDNPENSKPRLMYMNPKSGLGMSAGFTALSGKNNNYAIGVTGGKFFVFDPGKTDETTDYTKLPHHSFSGDTSGTTIEGKTTVFGDIMLINGRINGDTWIADISKLDVDAGVFDVEILAHFKFSGNPDLGKIFGTRIVYPLGNQGVLSFSLDDVYENHGVSVNVKTARGEGKAPSEGKRGKFTLRDAFGKVAAVFYEKDDSSNIVDLTAYVPVGEYTLSIEKSGYLTATEKVTVEGETKLPEITLIPGDIPEGTDKPYGNGVIDMNDIIKVLCGFASGNDAESVRTLDINEDGNVNVMDLVLTIRGMRMAS